MGVRNSYELRFMRKKKLFHDGVISMICTRDLVNWSAPIVVLEETCHLSFPWVFEKNGNIYMIPETCCMKSVRLYKGNSDLSKFRYEKTILCEDREQGISFSDTFIHEQEGCYYLITTIIENNKNILKLYISDKWDGEYIEHPSSPICENNKYGRNAGCFLSVDGKLIRPAQDCENGYGDNVHLLEVKEVTKELYREEPIKEYFLPKDSQFFKYGGHQYNIVKFNGKYIIATDAKEYHYFFIRRVIRKILFRLKH